MWIALACIADLGALVNLLQVITGRQVIRPAASRRSTLQLSRESAAAVLIWSGMALLALHVSMVGFPVEALGIVALSVVRRPASRVSG
ncbi:hypothetical protein [Streptacidiphilus fuscans]|uniref:Integral membrane protein n=1 Tax=Streptacidiphilus fuscans TaxID=2789292 RepID=A0A931FHJ7_9ACTN|nr:hypothetical protein [Streptacidiphilus fuscans]MBF9071901.1 hypothetical protein [Streptacidiphilus fuscans]